MQLDSYQPMSWTSFHLITTNISENGLSPPQAIIFFHLLQFLLFFYLQFSNNQHILSEFGAQKERVQK